MLGCATLMKRQVWKSGGKEGDGRGWRRQDDQVAIWTIRATRLSAEISLIGVLALGVWLCMVRVCTINSNIDTHPWQKRSKNCQPDGMFLSRKSKREIRSFQHTATIKARIPSNFLAAQSPTHTHKQPKHTSTLASSLASTGCCVHTSSSCSW